MLSICGTNMIEASKWNCRARSGTLACCKAMSSPRGLHCSLFSADRGPGRLDLTGLGRADAAQNMNQRRQRRVPCSSCPVLHASTWTCSLQALALGLLLQACHPELEVVLAAPHSTVDPARHAVLKEIRSRQRQQQQGWTPHPAPHTSGSSSSDGGRHDGAGRAAAAMGAGGGRPAHMVVALTLTPGLVYAGPGGGGAEVLVQEEVVALVAV